MAFAKNILLGGISGPTADAINGQVTAGLTAKGPSQALSLLVSGDINYFSTVSASSAVTLYAGQGGDNCIIANAGTSSLWVFPPSGAAFLGTATNAAVTLSPNANCTYTCVNATTWLATLSAGGNTA